MPKRKTNQKKKIKRIPAVKKFDAGPQIKKFFEALNDKLIALCPKPDKEKVERLFQIKQGKLERYQDAQRSRLQWMAAGYPAPGMEMPFNDHESIMEEWTQSMQDWAECASAEREKQLRINKLSYSNRASRYNNRVVKRKIREEEDKIARKLWGHNTNSRALQKYKK